MFKIGKIIPPWLREFFEVLSYILFSHSLYGTAEQIVVFNSSSLIIFVSRSTTNILPIAICAFFYHCGISKEGYAGFQSHDNTVVSDDTYLDGRNPFLSGVAPIVYHTVRKGNGLESKSGCLRRHR